MHCSSLTNTFTNPSLTILLASVFALIFGSFLGASSYRIARQFIESTKRPIRFFEKRSKCPSCGHPLKPIHLIPVLSWIVLKGKCAFCGALISRKYLLIELGTLASALCALMVTPYIYEQAELFILGSMLITLAVIDFKYLILPDVFLIPLLPFPLITIYCAQTPLLTLNLLGGAVFGVLLFTLVRYLYLKTKKIEGLGIGDIKLIGIAGLWVGLDGINWVILLGVFSTLLGMLALGKDLRKSRHIPFGPGLCFGFYSVYLAKFLGLL